MTPLLRMVFGAAIFCLSFGLNVSADASGPVNLEFSPRKITVGDPIDMRLTVNAPPGTRVVWPTGEQLAPAEVIRMDTSDTKGERRSIRYVLSLFEPGKQDLPDIPVLLVSTEGADTLWVNPGQVQVESVSNNRDTALVDIRPPVRLPWTLKEALPYIIAGVILIGGAVAAIILVRRAKRKRGEIPEYVPPPLPPDVIAMRRLEDLRIRKLWQDGKIKEYHSELTEIIKEYLGGRYGFNAPEMTSEELLDARDRWVQDDEGLSRIRRILSTADFVKFAKFKPSPHDHEKSLETAFAFVEATRSGRPALMEGAKTS